MFFRKYFAFVETTFPWVFCCFLTWFLDRLFVELGHRNTDSPTCTHNDLQYVQWHQYVTIVAVLAQIIHVIRIRKLQFYRELSLMGVGLNKPCIHHIYFIQVILCVSWATIITCLIDVSPWLCLPTILNNRASITSIASICIYTCIIIERKIWGWTLERTLTLDPDTIDI